MNGKQSIYANLPKVVRFLGVEDMGEEADAHCPHCGAQGRYIYYFECEDGTRRGAMKGCYKHFPKSWTEKYTYAIESGLHQVFEVKDKSGNVVRIDKEDYAATEKEQKVLDAAAALAAGKITESEAETIIRRNCPDNLQKYLKKDFGTYFCG
jgi:hypothetical protein